MPFVFAEAADAAGVGAGVCAAGSGGGRASGLVGCEPLGLARRGRGSGANRRTDVGDRSNVENRRLGGAAHPWPMRAAAALALAAAVVALFDATDPRDALRDRKKPEGQDERGQHRPPRRER